VISPKTWLTLAVITVVFGALWFGQVAYFDAYTNQLTLREIGPVTTGYLSENLQSAVSRPLVIRGAAKDIVIKPDQLAAWIEPHHRIFTNRVEFRANTQQIENDLTDFAASVGVQAIDARFGIASGSMMEVTPAQIGKRLDFKTSTQNIVQAMAHNISEAMLVLTDVPPALNLEKLAKAGITAQLARGSSNFVGSPASRVHNIRTGASKFDHTFIQPGEEFSFNDRVGNIDASTGYLTGLVIKGTKLVPEYGGGLCQVSTTMFRAAALAGLAIIERRPHALPVKYYNPQGFDATVYTGAADLRFRNDTSAPILIQTVIKGTEIAFEFYGSPDGRVTKLNGPIVYESNSDGSLKTLLTRTVTYPPPPYGSGETKKDQFYSSYKSPALFETIRNPLE